MKKILILLFALTLLAGGGYYGVSKVLKARCTSWFDTAAKSLDSGFYAETHRQLTLYFTQERCRSKNDPEAVAMLAQARLYVPLPENAHLTQQLLLFRLGMGLQENSNLKNIGQEKALASAYLVRGNWLDALRAAKKANKHTHDDEVALIQLAAAVALEDKQETETAITLLTKSGLSPFKAAFLDVLAGQNTFFQSIWIRDKTIQHTSNAHQLAYTLIMKGAPPPSMVVINQLAKTMTVADLHTTSSLLASKGHPDHAIALLQQRGNSLPKQLQIRLARLLWLKGDYIYLANGFTDAHSQAPHAPEVILMVCLAEKIISAACTTQFDSEDYQQRSGVFAASRWATVLYEASKPAINIANLLNALDHMDTLLAGSPVLPQLRFTLLSAIGEEELAMPYLKQAKMWNAGTIITGLIPPQDKQQYVAKTNAQRCMNIEPQAKQTCWSKALASHPNNMTLWRIAIADGKLLNNKELEKLQRISPTQATLWRIAKARYLLAQTTEETRAEALTVLETVWQKAPSIPEGHLLASTAYMRFDVPDKAFSHFAAISEQSPEEVVTVLRLALWFYEKEGRMDAPTLVRWWSALTWLEMSSRKTKNKQVEGPQLLMERLSLLAARADEAKDEYLARAVYIKMLEIEPQNHIALNNMAYLLSFTTDRLTEAKRMALKAIELWPEQAEYKKTLITIQKAMAGVELMASPSP